MRYFRTNLLGFSAGKSGLRQFIGNIGKRPNQPGNVLIQR